MSEVVVLIFLFSFLVLCLMAVAVRLGTLSREVQQTNSLIVAQISEKPPAKLVSAGDPIVHDAHSDDDRYASVTAKAGKVGGW